LNLSYGYIYISRFWLDCRSFQRLGWSDLFRRYTHFLEKELAIQNPDYRVSQSWAKIDHPPQWGLPHHQNGNCHRASRWLFFGGLVVWSYIYKQTLYLLGRSG